MCKLSRGATHLPDTLVDMCISNPQPVRMWSKTVKQRHIASGALLVTGIVAFGPGNFRLSRREGWPAPQRHHESAEQLAATHQRQIAILSQNMWNSFYAGGPQRLERMQAFKEFIQEAPADILVLQEMFTFGLGPLCEKSEAELFQQWMWECGFLYQTSSLATMPFLGQSSGLMICSKKPIFSERHRIFTERRTVTAKGWLEVEVQLSSMDLVILTTHMEHAQTPKWRRVREQQWREVVDRVKELLLEKDSVIVVGDFNVCGQELGIALDGGSEYKSMVASFAQCGLAEVPLTSTLRANEADISRD
ncbi:unnamed protein product [Durusdinium trenchii]|uniref:Endonuclease/exonuclease/phosphatase domain-containing protein n=1 Tax=Durusdinium trenchii TaxID=1381693 RepID=A0ABP0HPZ9_9DINO